MRAVTVAVALTCTILILIACCTEQAPTTAQLYTPASLHTPTPQRNSQPFTINTEGTIMLQLSVNGAHIENSNGNIVVLRGVNYDSGRFHDLGYWDSNQMGYIKTMGCNVVVIAIGWWDLPGIYSDGDFWTRLDEMMASAQNNGLYVVFSGFGMAGHSLESCGLDTASWLSLWATIAERYASYNNIIYQPIAEYLHWTYTAYQTNLRNAIDTIRTYSPNAVIMVQATGTGDGNWPCTFTFQDSYPINRPNLVFSCDPYGFFTYPNNSQSLIYSALSTMIDFEAVDDSPLFFGEFGGYSGVNGDYAGWAATWLVNFMSVMDSYGYSGYSAWRWCTTSDDVEALSILSDWDGNLSSYGTDLKTYYLAHSNLPIPIVSVVYSMMRRR